MNVKTMTYFVVAALLCGLFYMGWKLTSRNAYESAKYSVLSASGEFELREYPNLMLVTTPMGSSVDGSDGSFGRLFRYISGDNEGEQKVAMTTPVFIEAGSDQSTGQMGFVLPSDVASSQVPVPVNQQVQVTEREGGQFAVVRFSGRVNPTIRKKKQTELEAWIEQQGYQPAAEAEIASYDPPWTPGPLRRNEILIRVKQ